MIFFLLLQWKSPYEIANISDHRTRNLSKDIFFCNESLREMCIDYCFCNWKQEKMIIGAETSIRRIKTRKFDFLLTCTKSNNVLDFWVKSQTLPFFNAYLHTYIIFGIFRTPIRYVPFCWNDGVILFPNSRYVVFLITFYSLKRYFLRINSKLKLCKMSRQSAGKKRL